MYTNNTRGISSDIRINGQNLETVQRYKYSSVMKDEGSKQEIMSKIAQADGALSKLNTIIWKNKDKALGSKIRMIRSLVISIFLYVCETSTLTAKLERKIQATGMRFFRRSEEQYQACYWVV